MAKRERAEPRVFATEESRQKSKRIYLLALKLTLLPFLTILGLTSGLILVNAGVPRGIGLLCSLVVGPGLPWLALRVLNRRARSWYAIRPDGLEVGPGKAGWLVPFEQVELIRESYVEEPTEPYLQVVAGSKNASILLSRDVAKRCALALVKCCPCAVWIDEQGGEHLPGALEDDPSSEPARRAVRNMALLRAGSAQAVVRLGGVFLVGLAGLAVVAASSLGLLPLGAEKQEGIAIPSIFLACVFGIAWWGELRQLRAWDRLCKRFDGSSSLTEDEADELARWREVDLADAPNDESYYELGWPTSERRKAVILTLLIVGVAGWVAAVIVLQLWLLPHESNERRAAFAAILVAPVAAWAAWRSGVRRDDLIWITPDGIALRKGGVCEKIAGDDVLALIGQGGPNLDGGELIVWKGLVILTEGGGRVLRLPHEDNAELYRRLRATCPHAWGIPFPARLEPPPLARRPGVGSAATAELGAVGRFQRRQIVRSAVMGLVVCVGSLALLMFASFHAKVDASSSKALVGLLVFAILGGLLIATALRDSRVLRTIQQTEFGEHLSRWD